jgi:hypothetical protein
MGGPDTNAHGSPGGVVRGDDKAMKPRARRIALTALLLALFSMACAQPPSVSRPETGPTEPGTTKVRVEILALIYDDVAGFRCDYEVLEDTGGFKKGQRARSGSLSKNFEEPILAYTRDRKGHRCIFHFDEEGNLCTVSLEIVHEE